MVIVKSNWKDVFKSRGPRCTPPGVQVRLKEPDEDSECRMDSGAFTRPPRTSRVRKREHNGDRHCSKGGDVEEEDLCRDEEDISRKMDDSPQYY